jgi:hypothetical protein
MSAGAIPGGRVKARLLGLGRSLLVNGFLSHFDRAEISSRLEQVVDWKIKDPNMSPGEIERMRDLARQAVKNA